MILHVSCTDSYVLGKDCGWLTCQNEDHFSAHRNDGYYYYDRWGDWD